MRKRRTDSKSSIVERMRQQMALKQVRARALELGIPVEDYLRKLEEQQSRRQQKDRLDDASETLARRIIERMRQEPPAAPPAGPAASPLDDLKGLVDKLMQPKGKP